MELRYALDAIDKKEEEGKERMKKADNKAGIIRFKGEEEASSTYRKVREQLKDETKRYKSDWAKRLDRLEADLKKELVAKKRKIKAQAGRRKKKAQEAGYLFMVGNL